MAKYLHHFETQEAHDSEYTSTTLYHEPWVGLVGSASADVTFNKSTITSGRPYVDLGLPSGTLWSPRPLMQTQYDIAGLDEFNESQFEYHRFGELTPTNSNTTGDVSTYRFYDGPNGEDPLNYYIKKYKQYDGLCTLQMKDDIIHRKWGGYWHIPTESQISELANGLTYFGDERNDLDDVIGHVYESNYNENKISFLLAGHYVYSLDGALLEPDLSFFGSSFLIPSSTAYLFNDDVSEANSSLMLYFDPTDEEYPLGITGFMNHAVIAACPYGVIDGPGVFANGHEYVDLGLPSGTLWAKRNVGANSEEEEGDVFRWGESETLWSQNYTWENGYPFFNNKGHTGVREGHDPARRNMGGDWCVPTLEQFWELFANTIVSVSDVNGIDGFRFTSAQDASKSIFIQNTFTNNYMTTNRCAGGGEDDTEFVYIRAVTLTDPSFADENIVRMSEHFCVRAVINPKKNTF